MSGWPGSSLYFSLEIPSLGSLCNQSLSRFSSVNRNSHHLITWVKSNLLDSYLWKAHMTHSLSLDLLLTSILLFLLSPSSLSPFSLLPTSSSPSSTFSLFFCVSLWSLPPLPPLTSFLLSYSLLLMCSFLNLFLPLLHILCMSICVNNIFVLRAIDHPEVITAAHRLV